MCGRADADAVGRSVGRTDGRADERSNGRADGRTDVRSGGRGRIGGRADGRSVGQAIACWRMDGRKYTGGQTDAHRRTEDRADDRRLYPLEFRSPPAYIESL